MFFMCVATFMAPYMMTTNVFQGERPVFLREQANQMYDVIPYYSAKMVSDIPGFVIVPLIFTAITYWLIGFQNDIEQFFMFVLSLGMNTLAAISLGYFMSSAIRDETTALILSPIMAMPLMLVGGFYSNAGSMPIYIEVFSYVSPIMYAFNNIAKLEFSNSPYPNAEKFLKFMDI